MKKLFILAMIVIALCNCSTKSKDPVVIYSVDSLSNDPIRLISGEDELELTGKVSILRPMTDTIIAYAEYNDSIIKCILVARADQLILRNPDSTYNKVTRADLQPRYYPWLFFTMDSARIPTDSIKFLRAVK